jgi:transcriptional/translational regulatory protein YebC/TACO1
MIFAKAEDVEELSDNAATTQLVNLSRGFSKIANHFRDTPAEENREILSKLLEILDEADDVNVFGSEGWRYFFE